MHTAHFLPLAAIVARAHFRLQAIYPPVLAAAHPFLLPASPDGGIDVAQDGDLQAGLKTSIDWCVSIPAVGKGPGWEVPSSFNRTEGKTNAGTIGDALPSAVCCAYSLADDRDKGPAGPLSPGSLPTA